METNIIYLVILFMNCYVNCQNLPEVDTQIITNGDLVIDFKSEGIIEERVATIPVNSPVPLIAKNVPKYASFLLFQTHSFGFNLTISYNETIHPNFHVNGTNIGLINKLSDRVYIINTNQQPVPALLVIQQYRQSDPIPGGCNMEFSVETAPYLEIVYTEALVVMKSQLAAAPNTYNCKVQYPWLHYDVYHLFLNERDFTSETYFNGIRNMLSIDRILANGRKVPVPFNQPLIRRIFSAYPGTGSVYAVIVRTNFSAAAYVPAVTYACSNTDDASNTCEVLTTIFSKFLCAIIFFLGIFICFAGHYFFKTELFLLGFFSGSFMSYMLITLPDNFEHEMHLVVAVLIGIVCGSFWLATWYLFGIPAFSSVLVSIIIGYFIAAITLFFGAGDLDMFQASVNYWTFILCVVVGAPLILILTGHVTNIIGSGIIGAYAIIGPLDHYIGSNLKYIVINTVRRAVDSHFRTAVVDPPFQLRDKCLIAVWFFLALVGSLVQLTLLRNKPPYPPPPSWVSQDARVTSEPDRQPLLANAHSTASYESIPNGGNNSLAGTSNSH